MLITLAWVLTAVAPTLKPPAPISTIAAPSIKPRRGEEANHIHSMEISI